MSGTPLPLDRRTYKRYIRLALTPVVMLAIHVLYYLINPESSLWNIGSTLVCKQWATDLTITFLFCWLLIEVSIGIADGLEGWFPWSSSSLLRFIVQTVCTLLASVIILLIEDQVYAWIYPETPTPKEVLEAWQFIVVNLIVALMVSTYHTGYYLLNRWKTTLEEAAELKVKTLELKEMALQAELQSLKLQLDPHFLFNNFSTLSELILENPSKASLFLDKLAKVYRYMIQNMKQDLVPLKDEIAFVKAYQYLIGIRHGQQVLIELDLNPALGHKWIPPISIQLLIENAIKHNRATRTEPLTIRIEQVGNRLCVTNNIQPFPTPLPSSGLGLENIKNRYRILSSQVPVVNADGQHFWVELPLFDFPHAPQSSLSLSTTHE